MEAIAFIDTEIPPPEPPEADVVTAAKEFAESDRAVESARCLLARAEKDLLEATVRRDNAYAAMAQHLPAGPSQSYVPTLPPPKSSALPPLARKVYDATSVTPRSVREIRRLSGMREAGAHLTHLKNAGLVKNVSRGVWART
jgi:hypothetical protein